MATGEPDLIVSDGQLLRRYLRGDAPGAFADLVRRHAGFVYSVAFRQTRDRHLAEDVAQNVFLLLARKAPALGTHEDLCGWLFTTTMFESRNLLKSRRREARRIERHALATATATRDDAMEPPTWDEVEPHLDEALESLDEGERRAVILRYLRRNAYDQVAAALGVSPAAARQRVHRGLERMRAFLTKRGVVASLGGLATAMKLNGVQSPPADLVANTVEAATRLADGVGAAKGALVMASVKSHALAAALILGSLGLAAAGTAVITRHGQAPQTIYLDPGPGDRAAPAPAPAAGSQLPAPNAAVRPAFQLIRAASYDGAQGTRTVGGFVGYINKGDWLRFNHLDLGPPSAGGSTFTALVACPEKYAGNTVEVRQDSPAGPVLATLTVRSTGGHIWRTQSVPTLPYPGGVHDLFLRFSGGGWNLDTFNFAPAARPALGPIMAVTFNQASGLQTRGGVLCDTGDEHWARYNALDFGPGIGAVAVTYSCDAAHAGGAITLRLDRLDGPPAAEFPVASTGSFGQFVTRTLPLDSISGRHDVFLTFSGQSNGIANVSKFEFRPPPAGPPHPSAPGVSTSGGE